MLFQLERKYDGDIRFRVAERDLLYTNPDIYKKDHSLLMLNF